MRSFLSTCKEYQIAGRRGGRRASAPRHPGVAGRRRRTVSRTRRSGGSRSPVNLQRRLLGKSAEHTREGDLVRETQPVVGTTPPQGDLSSVGLEKGGIAESTSWSPKPSAPPPAAAQAAANRRFTWSTPRRMTESPGSGAVAADRGRAAADQAPDVGMISAMRPIAAH